MYWPLAYMKCCILALLVLLKSRCYASEINGKATLVMHASAGVTWVGNSKVSLNVSILASLKDVIGCIKLSI